jgi:hypothetical protein
MKAVKAYYDGRTFVPTMPVNVKKNRAVIVTILDDEIVEPEKDEPVHSARSWDAPDSWLNNPIHVAKSWDDPDSCLNNPIHIGEGYRKITREEIYDERIDENRCTTVYSEDMQDGQIIENTLTIKNPFVV